MPASGAVVRPGLRKVPFPLLLLSSLPQLRPLRGASHRPRRKGPVPPGRAHGLCNTCHTELLSADITAPPPPSANREADLSLNELWGWGPEASWAGWVREASLNGVKVQSEHRANV